MEIRQKHYDIIPYRRGTHAGTAGEVFETLGADTAGSKILGSASWGTSFPLATVLLVAMSAGAFVPAEWRKNRRRRAIEGEFLARRRALSGIRVLKCFSRKELKLFTLPL